MKIIDLDSITFKNIPLVKMWILESFNSAGLPIEALYFFSTDREVDAIEKARRLGFVHERIDKRNYWNGSSIHSLLLKMLNGLNEERKKYDLPAMDTFDKTKPRKVSVLSSREFSEIERIGAEPIPAQIMGG